ncbi:hypothetical protein CDCA_CDCA08G2364 [Cyanidium caldarium]|uniref:Magnesium transporter n=1 Tax=Cyanidium caldarium TaxID=2771 RepID=A0AAV9IVM5_CYACA|nr:hypothetical protein CDCA_CDCA08G2364 [Cyanidium caldarium]
MASPSGAAPPAGGVRSGLVRRQQRRLGSMAQPSNASQLYALAAAEAPGGRASPRDIWLQETRGPLRGLSPSPSAQGAQQGVSAPAVDGVTRPAGDDGGEVFGPVLGTAKTSEHVDEKQLLKSGLTLALVLAQEHDDVFHGRYNDPIAQLTGAGVMQKWATPCVLFDAFGKRTEMSLTREQLMARLREEPTMAMTAAGQVHQTTLSPAEMPAATDVLATPDITDGARETAPTSVSQTLDLDAYPVRRPRASRGARSKKRSKYGPVQYRDVRALDPAFNTEPMLVVRDQAILAVLDNHIRAAIQCNRLFLFDAACTRGQQAARIVAQHLQSAVADDYCPFEFAALEALLIAACHDLEVGFARLEPLIAAELNDISTQPSQLKIEQLRIDESRLALLLSRAQHLLRLLEHVLDDDEDMSHLYLTEMRCHPERSRRPLEHDEAELLLESYLQAVQSLAKRMELLDRTINDTEEVVEIKLSMLQNRLWSFSILVHLVVATLFIAAVPADYFGMNVELPLFAADTPGWVWGIVMVVNLSVGLAFFLVAFGVLSRRGLLFGVQSHQ